MDTQETRQMTFVEWANDNRRKVKDLAANVKAMKSAGEFRGEQAFADQHSEMISNVMLAYRHLEDASMRLGKAIQAADGGTSVYDKETTVGA